MKKPKNFQAIAFGEVLWDVYPDYRKPGGAPLNVLGHLQQLGFSTSMVSRVGQDDLGSEMLQNIDALGIDRTFIQLDSKYATGVVNVQLDENGKPTYEIVEPVAWDQITLDPELISRMEQIDLLICGTLAARCETSRSTLQALLKASSCTIFDMNLRMDFYSPELIKEILAATTILKLNDEEFDVLTKLFVLERNSLYSYLMEEFDVKLIIQTRGADGAEVYDGNSTIEHPGYAVSVVDTVGSGDAFLAGFLCRYFQGNSLDACLDFGCKLGSFVATQKGAIPTYTIDQFN